MSSYSSVLLAGAISVALLSSGCAKKEGAPGVTPAVVDQAQQAAPKGDVKAAGRSAASVTEVAKKAPAPPPPRKFTVEAGTPVAVRTITALTTKTAKAGAAFQGTLAEDLVVGGHVIAPKGAIVNGEVADSDPGGRVKGVASLSLVLTSLHTVDAGPVDVRSEQFTQTAKSTKGKDAAKVGISSGVGAAIGAIAGGGKGAAIGAGVGAAGGTGLVMATRGAPAELPAESLVTFTLSAPFTVTEKR